VEEEEEPWCCIYEHCLNFFVPLIQNKQIDHHERDHFFTKERFKIHICGHNSKLDNPHESFAVESLVKLG
jgi:hypothetical protein